MKKKNHACTECHDEHLHKNEHSHEHDSCCHEHSHEHSHEHKHEHDHEHEIDACGCGHEHSHEEGNKAVSVVTMVIAALLIVASFLLPAGETVKAAMLVISAVLSGYPVFIAALRSIKKKTVDETLLLMIAVVAAFIIGEFFEAAAVTFFFRIGEMLEDYASDRSRRSIESLFGIVSDTANLVEEDGSYKKIDADDVKIGMKLAVLPHEIFPVDGISLSENASVDASALTGESLPVSVEKGEKILSGSINCDSTVIIEACAGKNESSAARIVKMVEDAAAKKGNAQRAVAVFAKYYTPAVVIAAILAAVIPSVISGDAKVWIHKALLMLVASCPCAIVLSAPLAFFSTMGAAAKNGMIIKGSRYIEALAKADTAVFDKTGTLTTGELKIDKIYAANGETEKSVLEYAAKCEYHSTHPIAKAIVAEFGEPDIKNCSDFKEIAGGGTSVMTENGEILCGGTKLMKQNDVDISAFPDVSVYVALNGRAVGAISVTTKLREDAPKTIESLRKLGIKNIVMLTGDKESSARLVCEQCGIGSFESDLLPENKLSKVEELKKDSSGVIYVGDGINDAPVLAAADVGVAMGLGTQAACEASDVILTNSEFSRLADTIYQSKNTMTVLRTNIVFALVIKALVIALGFAFNVPMWMAIFADVGTMIISVINSARLLKVKRFSK